MNFQETPIILNAHTKKVCKPIEFTTYTENKRGQLFRKYQYLARELKTFCNRNVTMIPTRLHEHEKGH